MASTCRIQPDRFCSTTKPGGDRDRQREGWPAGTRSAEATQHQWFAQEVAEMRAQRNGSEAEGKGEALQLRTMANENIKLAKLWDSPLQLLVYTNADGARSDRPGVHGTNA